MSDRLAAAERDHGDAGTHTLAFLDTLSGLVDLEACVSPLPSEDSDVGGRPKGKVMGLALVELVALFRVLRWAQHAIETLAREMASLLHHSFFMAYSLTVYASCASIRQKVLLPCLQRWIPVLYKYLRLMDAFVFPNERLPHLRAAVPYPLPDRLATDSRIERSEEQSAGQMIGTMGGEFVAAEALSQKGLGSTTQEPEGSGGGKRHRSLGRGKRRMASNVKRSSSGASNEYEEALASAMALLTGGRGKKRQRKRR